MLKRFTAILLILCLTVPLIGFSDATSNDGCCDLMINDSLVELTTPPLLIDGVAMLPMREFFEKLGATVTWYEQTKVVTVYKYNMQVKLTIDQSIAYRNGKSFNLTHSPVIVADRTYLPAKFIAESFDMLYQFKDNAITLTKRDVSKVYFINFMEFSSIDLEAYDMTMILPYGWNELSDNRFGIENDMADYSISVQQYDATLPNNTALAAEIKRTLSDEYGSRINFTYYEPFYTSDLVYYSFGYFLDGPETERIVDNYLLKHENFYYLFKCDSAAGSDITFVRNMTYNILDRIQFNSDTILTSDEHYFEYGPFFKAKLSLTEPLSSNMEIYNYVPFSGKIGAQNMYDNLYAIVSKDDEQMKFKISISDDGSFQAKIFTPFGIAKHNIAIYGKRTSGKNELLLRFSALNLSNEEIKYLIPSEYIQSNKTEALSLASFLTYQTNSSYMKAKLIFEHMVTDIALENVKNQNSEDLRNSTDVITGQRATPLEMCLTMTALLRASDISSRVIASYSDGQIFYAVEAKINGLWVVYDPVNYLLQQQSKATGQFSQTVAKFKDLAPYYYIKNNVYMPLFNNYRILSH